MPPIRARKIRAPKARTCLLAFALLAGAAGAAHAQPADITGAWAFETQVYANGCRMSGLVSIKPDPHGRHQCTFTTKEACNDITVQAKESCTATRAAGKLTIKSKVDAITPQVGYDPDDFDLTIDGGSHMTGMMRSYNSAPVEFFRGQAPIS